jgi:hypothetical protein
MHPRRGRGAIMTPHDSHTATAIHIERREIMMILVCLEIRNVAKLIEERDQFFISVSSEQRFQ